MTIPNHPTAHAAFVITGFQGIDAHKIAALLAETNELRTEEILQRFDELALRTGIETADNKLSDKACDALLREIIRTKVLLFEMGVTCHTATSSAYGDEVAKAQAALDNVVPSMHADGAPIRTINAADVRGNPAQFFTVKRTATPSAPGRSTHMLVPEGAAAIVFSWHAKAEKPLEKDGLPAKEDTLHGRDILRGGPGERPFTSLNVHEKPQPRHPGESKIIHSYLIGQQATLRHLLGE